MTRALESREFRPVELFERAVLDLLPASAKALLLGVPCKPSLARLDCRVAV
jgi:hypothetical protein